MTMVGAVAAGMTPLLRKLLGMNWVLVLTMFGLLIFGVFSIESAARHLPQGGAWYAERQKFIIMAGALVFFVTALIDYRWIRWLGIPMYLSGLALLVLAMLKGNEVHQLQLGSINFQPAQFAIASGIILLSWLLQDIPKLHRWLGLPIVRIGLIGVITGLPFLIVVAMGDMGSGLVWLPFAVVAMLVGGVPFRYLSFMALCGLAILPLVYFVVFPQISHRGTQRIEMYLDMLNNRPVDTSGDAWAPYYVSMAIGKAGWQGSGWNSSVDGSLHANKFIPWKTAHNDFIFAVIAEEQGFRGSLLLLTSFGLLLVSCLFIAFYSRDMMGRLIAAGVVAVLFAHVFENIGMCVLLTPITGIPLPLVSYSGTFVLICMFLLGLVQSVWVHRKLGSTSEVPSRNVETDR